MSEIFELQAQVRDIKGKGASRRLRRSQDLVPAIVYGGEEDATSIMIKHKEVLKAIQYEAFFSHILTLHIDGKPQKVVIKDMQRHPYKPIIIHMDFLRVSSKQKIHMNVPIHFLNEEESPGVDDGGVVSHSMKEIEVICLPSDLPEYIEVDIGKLNLDESIHLSDIKAPQGVEFVAISHGEDPDIASVHMPKIIEEPTEEEVEEEAEGETEEGAETEEGTESDEEGAEAKEGTDTDKKSKED